MKFNKEQVRDLLVNAKCRSKGRDVEWRVGGLLLTPSEYRQLVDKYVQLLGKKKKGNKKNTPAPDDCVAHDECDGTLEDCLSYETYCQIIDEVCGEEDGNEEG